MTPSLENGILSITHTPGKTDTADTFSCDDENNLIVTRSSANKGRSYFLKDGKLYANNGFNGTLTATAVYSTVKTREIDFEYNHSGLRTKKVVKEAGITTTTEYIYHGKIVTHLIKTVVDANGNETSKEELHFFYDAQSRPAFVKYNNAMYRYIHNLQGDIIGIVDAAGTLVVEYKYDSWGKLLSITGTKASTLGDVNPFRYRGYVWDGEAGLYYLENRYYASNINRFLNADRYVATDEDLVACNMFAYCINDPIMQYDPTGNYCICLSQRIWGNHVCYADPNYSEEDIPNFALYKEHTNNARPSTKYKHQEGQSRRQRDARGEKGDARRKENRSNKRKNNNESRVSAAVTSVIVVGAMIYVVLNDITGVGAADDSSIIPLGTMLWDNLTVLFG